MILKDVRALLGARPVVAVVADDTVQAAAETMARENARAVAVLDGGAVAGVLSEKDIVQKCVAKGLDVAGTPVSAIMSADPVTVDAGDTVAHAIEKMIAGDFHHLPVLDGGALIGMVYSDDIPEEYRMLLEHFNEFKRG